MSKVPSRKARLAHAAQHAELWNAGKKDEWVASWRTICPGEVRLFDPVGAEGKHGFAAATSDAFDMFQSILTINRSRASDAVPQCIWLMSRSGDSTW